MLKLLAVTIIAFLFVHAASFFSLLRVEWFYEKAFDAELSRSMRYSENNVYKGIASNRISYKELINADHNCCKTWITFKSINEDSVSLFLHRVVLFQTADIESEYMLDFLGNVVGWRGYRRAPGEFRRSS